MCLQFFILFLCKLIFYLARQYYNNFASTCLYCNRYSVSLVIGIHDFYLCRYVYSVKKVLIIFHSFPAQLMAFICSFFLPAIIAVAYAETYVAKDIIPTTLSLFFRFLTFINLHTSNSHISGST